MREQPAGLIGTRASSRSRGGFGVRPGSEMGGCGAVWSCVSESIGRGTRSLGRVEAVRGRGLSGGLRQGERGDSSSAVKRSPRDEARRAVGRAS